MLNGTNLNNAQAYVTVSMKAYLTSKYRASGSFTALRDACLGMTYSTLQIYDRGEPAVSYR